MAQQMMDDALEALKNNEVREFFKKELQAAGDFDAQLRQALDVKTPTGRYSADLRDRLTSGMQKKRAANHTTP